MAQQEIWKDITSKLTDEYIQNAMDHPDEFQVDLKEAVDLQGVPGARLLEAGSFIGITSLLIDDHFDKTLLDLNPEAMGLARKIFEAAGKSAKFIAGDLFEMPFPNGCFDIVFNAGVLEHFDFEARSSALRECARVLKGKGTLIIAFPNHFSRPYKLAYHYLNRTGRWPFPPEKSLLDLKEEVRSAGLLLLHREVTSKKTAFQYLSYFPRFRRYALKIFFSIFPYEGYLTILVMRKVDE